MRPQPNSSNNAIVHAALHASTADEAFQVQRSIAEALGTCYYRPLADRWNNHGLMAQAGNYDLKLIELITNMQDSVIEARSLKAFESTESVPFASPQQAVAALFPDRAKLRDCEVRFRESDPPTPKTKRLTAVFRDRGRGIRPGEVADSIFALGGSHKVTALFLQGAFGMGGAQTYRNAKSVILVSRCQPWLLQPSEPDRITVAVVEWVENIKGQTARYLVTGPWEKPGDVAEPWSCPAADYPDFEPGTYLALISYGVDGLHRAREGDERSFDTVANTRLFEPVLPVRFTNEIVRAERATTLLGLRVRLERSEHDFDQGEEVLPFRYDGQTFHLPISYTIFEAQRPGSRRGFVAKDHAVLFTSNGQVHHHWTIVDLRNHTSLKKLADRLLVVVNTDELPIGLRTKLFTPDRTNLVRGDAALRLEEDVRAFIDAWDSLREANNRLIRESYRARSDQSTAEIARRISRALTAKGYSLNAGSGNDGAGSQTGRGRAGGGRPGSLRQINLNQDPTLIDGPISVRAVIGMTRSLTFIVDVVDSFFEGRGQLQVTCDHPEVSAREITVGRGRGGRVRVNVAVPETVEPGTYQLQVLLEGWHRAAGGLGHRLDHVTKIEFVEQIEGTGSGSGKATDGSGNPGGSREGNNVALVWANPDEKDDWQRLTVGSIETIPAAILAEKARGYEELRSLGDTPIPTIHLNEEYPPFKKYLESRNKDLTSVERPREQYAVGVGVALLSMEAHFDSLNKQGRPQVDDETRSAMMQAAARAVLAVLPQFDDLAKEAGLAE